MEPILNGIKNEFAQVIDNNGFKHVESQYGLFNDGRGDNNIDVPSYLESMYANASNEIDNNMVDENKRNKGFDAVLEEIRKKRLKSKKYVYPVIPEQQLQKDIFHPVVNAQMNMRRPVINPYVVKFFLINYFKRIGT